MRRQRLFGAAIVVAVTALTTGFGTAARAEPATPVVSLDVPAELRLPIGRPDRPVTLRSSTANAVKPRAVFDLADLAGVATLQFPAGCATAGTTVTCPLPESGEHPFPLVAIPPATGTVGASGTVHVAVAADNVEPGTPDDMTLTLDNGVDLTIPPLPSGGSVASDKKLSVPGATVINLGNRTAVGLRVTYAHGDPTLVPAEYANCTSTASETACEFRDQLPPGMQLTLPAVEFSTTADSLGPKTIAVTVTAMKQTEGTGTNSESHELNPADNGSDFAFTVTNTYDIEALGATATGTVGTVVKVVIGARNNGQGTLDLTTAQQKAWRYYFVVPAGTETVAVPDRCAGKVTNGNTSEYVPGHLGSTLYECTHEGFRFPAKTSTTVEFSLKITQVVANATGTVSWAAPGTTVQVPADTKPANDTANVVVNGTAANTGDTLPITGVNVLAVAGVGFGLVLSGGALYAVSRRRQPGEADQAAN